MKSRVNIKIGISNRVVSGASLPSKQTVPPQIWRHVAVLLKVQFFFSKFSAIRGLLLLIVTFIRGTNYKKLFMVWNKPV